MKKWKIAAAAACVCFLFTVAYAANAGGANDPLVTLSYLNTTFSKQVQGMVDQTVDQRRAEMEDALAKVLEQGGPGTAGDRKSTRLNSSHITRSRMPSSA